ncbi:hypothetical protein [Streptomyces sp. KL110A]
MTSARRTPAAPRTGPKASAGALPLSDDRRSAPPPRGRASADRPRRAAP